MRRVHLGHRFQVAAVSILYEADGLCDRVVVGGRWPGTEFQSSTRLTAFATAARIREILAQVKVSILYEADGLCDPLGGHPYPPPPAVSILYEADGLCDEGA